MEKVRDLKNGQLVVGYVFAWDNGCYNPMQHWYGHAVTEWPRMPVSGPIFFYENSEPWARYQVHCAGCNTTSKGYKIRHSGLLTWSRAHRCEARVELNNTAYQKSGSMGTLEYNRFYGLPWNR